MHMCEYICMRVHVLVAGTSVLSRTDSGSCTQVRGLGVVVLCVWGPASPLVGARVPRDACRIRRNRQVVALARWAPCLYRASARTLN